MNDIIKYPKGEKVWVAYCDKFGKPMFIITSKSNRDFYYLYEIVQDGELKKLGRSRSPTDLENRFNIKSKIIT